MTIHVHVVYTNVRLYHFSLRDVITSNDLETAVAIIEKQATEEGKRHLLLSVDLEKGCKSIMAVELILQYVQIKDLKNSVIEEWREKDWLSDDVLNPYVFGKVKK